MTHNLMLPERSRLIQGSPPCFYPAGFTELLDEARAFFEELAHSPRVLSRPTAEDAKTVAGLFRKFWACTGMDASLGLSRGTPDQRRFRAALGDYLLQSEHIRYCLEKPRGYAGDFRMMEDICNFRATSANALGRWLEAWMFNEFPPYVSVRNRVEIMAALIAQESRRRAIRVLNVACGAAPEIRALGPEVELAALDLTDQDPAATQAALDGFAAVAAEKRAHIGQLSCFGHSVFDIVHGKHEFQGRRYDMIYSMGLYDYLDLKSSIRLTRRLWAQLEPGGIVAIGNFQGHHWARYVMEAVMDWFLVYKDPADLEALSAGIEEPHETAIVTDDTELLQVLLLRKPPANEPVRSTRNEAPTAAF